MNRTYSAPPMEFRVESPRHFSFVHRNRNWNNSFILHYWQRTNANIVCPNASISCHCLSSEMKTTSCRDINSKQNNCHESCMIFILSIFRFWESIQYRQTKYCNTNVYRYFLTPLLISTQSWLNSLKSPLFNAFNNKCVKAALQY